ncbi:hypothetical protein [Burkholderia glumae]|uniref:hypothetical protein n=1 Tax=Burkholderia glumae TaxID=337 RepID=UPI0002D4A0BE|nr:hypothetical protein [Burkholderia glumae]
MNTHIDTLNNVRATMAAAGIGADTQVHGQLRADHANNLVAMRNAEDSGAWARLGSTFLIDSQGQLGGDPSTFMGIAESWTGARALASKTGATSYSARVALNMIREGRLVLNGNTTVLFDERGALDSLRELQEACEAAGARLVQLGLVH